MAPSAPVRGPVSARLALSIGAAPKTERRDKNPRSTREEEDTADEAIEESPPP